MKSESREEELKVTEGPDLLYEVFTNTIDMKLVWISPGEFMMGSPDTEKGRECWEGPQHKVIISKGFWMSQTEVTQKQWKMVMGYNPSFFTKSSSDNLPVESVTWEEAVNFCLKLSQKEGRQYRLPTEAEWEYACRAGTSTPFNIGSTINTDQANYRASDSLIGSLFKKTKPVDKFQPNDWGLYDMHGNVSEWCQDWYDVNYYENSPTTDPEGPIKSIHQQRRIIRGGSWCSSLRHCRSASRGGEIINKRKHKIGFRVVCQYKDPSSSVP